MVIEYLKVLKAAKYSITMQFPSDRSSHRCDRLHRLIIAIMWKAVFKLFSLLKRLRSAHESQLIYRGKILRLFIIIFYDNGPYRQIHNIIFLAEVERNFSSQILMTLIFLIRFLRNETNVISFGFRVDYLVVGYSEVYSDQSKQSL